MDESSLRITEIFHSLQGESSLAGLPTTFIRLTGCPLRCVYCDTAYAFSGGERITVRGILLRVSEYSAKYVCVTGGEPLAQPECLVLLDRLVGEGYVVSLETSGAISIENVNSRVLRILDLKTPSSGEQSRNLWENMKFLSSRDQVKFVVGTPDDLAWAVSKTIEYDLLDRAQDVLISPVYGRYPLDELAQKILDTGLPLRLQIQQHKAIWGDAPGR